MLIDLRRLHPQMLALPDEIERKAQNRRGDGANRVEHVRDTDRVDPRRHGEDEDGAEEVADERQGCESVADDFCKNVRQLVPVLRAIGWA